MRLFQRRRRPATSTVTVTESEGEDMAKGVNKRTGKLKKGYRYAKGGRVVKVAAKSKGRRK